MVEKKKSTDYFPELEYRFFPIVFEEKTMEGIQGPVYQPSGRLLDLGESRTAKVRDEGGEIFHDGDTPMFKDSKREFDLGDADVEDWEAEEMKKSKPKVYGQIACPKCGGEIPITSRKRPLSIECPGCGKKGRID